MRLTGVRELGGRTYYSLIGFRTKGEAKKYADNLRKMRHSVRVFKVGPDWEVFATRTKIKRR